MKQARAKIREVLAKAKRPAAMVSFGKDSMLLLRLLEKEGVDLSKMPMLWFRTDRLPKQTAFARRMIRAMDLQVFSYAPMKSYFMSHQEGSTLVNEYAFGSHKFLNLVDIEPGDRETLDSETTPNMAHIWDYIFTGIKDSDYHPLIGYGRDYKPKVLGNAQVCSPMAHMTDEDVWKAIEKLSVPYDLQRYKYGDSSRDDGVLSLSAACVV